MKAIRVREPGGPEVLRWEDVTVGDPGAGEARIRHTAVGLNYVDVYYRTALYKAPSYPCWVRSSACRPSVPWRSSASPRVRRRPST